MKNNNNNYKAKRNNYKGRNDKKDYRKNEMGASTTNDPVWYAHYPELTANAGKLSMLYPAGAKLSFTYKEADSLVYDVSGVAALEYVPTYGFSDSLRSPLTKMSRTLYNNMVSKTNRVPAYEYTDLTMYQLALTNLVQFYYWAARIYLIAGSYTPLNANWNRAIFAALRVDSDDIRKNYALLYTYLIQFRKALSQFPFPKAFDLFSRTAQLTSNIYADSDSPKAQLYVFNPLGGYMWDREVETGSKLTYVKYRGDADITYDRIVQIGDMLLSAMSGDTDIQLMMSDILKVYSADLIAVNEVPLNGIINATYDPVILTQINNAMMTGEEPTGLDITQATDGAALEPYFIASPTLGNVDRMRHYLVDLKPMVNFLVADPDASLVTEGTRFMFTGEDATNHIKLTSFGSELMVQMRMVGFTSLGSYAYWIAGPVILNADTNDKEIVSRVTKYDWHPRVISWDETNGKYRGDYWDCSNYAFLTRQQIALLNETALVNLMRAFG